MIYRFTDEIREEEMKYTCAEASKILRKLKINRRILVFLNMSRESLVLILQLRSSVLYSQLRKRAIGPFLI